DRTLPRDAYRVLGSRQCGERAVRVDILERLADLIRPALSWRETSPGEKPAGAFDGRSFVVTQAMTSLTGSAGEDFASILRALGYRMERRPAPPPKPVAVETAAAADAAPAETASETPSAEAISSEAISSEVTAEPVVEAVNEAAPAADAAPTTEVTEAPAPAVEQAAASSTLLPVIDFAQGADASEAEPDNAATETKSETAD